jgi:hypothetical protein
MHTSNPSFFHPIVGLGVPMALHGISSISPRTTSIVPAISLMIFGGSVMDI